MSIHQVLKAGTSEGAKKAWLKIKANRAAAKAKEQGGQVEEQPDNKARFDGGAVTDKFWPSRDVVSGGGAAKPARDTSPHYSEDNLNEYVKNLHAVNAKYQARMGGHEAYKNTYEVTHGPRYAKVVQANSYGQKSVHSFIDKKNGDILFPAGFNAPAKNARGNISSEGFGAEAINPNGSVKMMNQIPKTKTQAPAAKPAQQAAPPAPKAPAPTSPAPTVSKAQAMETAKVTQKYYGGGKLSAMTGAKNYTSLTEGRGGLKFNIPLRNGINTIKAVLNAMDLYDVIYGRFNTKTGAFTVKHQSKGLYGDMLQKDFTEKTGLHTHL